MLRRTFTLRRGGASMRVKMQFDAAANVSEFNSAMSVCVRHELSMRTHKTEDAASLYGASIEALYRLVFGEETAQAIFDFFGNDVNAMLEQVNPLILNVVKPLVERESKRTREKLKHEFLVAQRRNLRV